MAVGVSVTLVGLGYRIVSTSLRSVTSRVSAPSVSDPSGYLPDLGERGEGGTGELVLTIGHDHVSKRVAVVSDRVTGAVGDAIASYVELE